MCSSGVVKQNKLYHSFIVNIFSSLFQREPSSDHSWPDRRERSLPTHEQFSQCVSTSMQAIPATGEICLNCKTHHMKEGNVLFNNALNTFSLRLYGVGHMVKGTIQIAREVTRCRHIGYSYRLTARVLLYASTHRQDNTYHGLCYTSRGALAGTRNSSYLVFQFNHIYCSSLIIFTVWV